MSEEVILDARTDARWSKTFEELAGRRDWNKMWQYAKTTPPIWTVRIIKFLTKQNWSPGEEDQIDLYRILVKQAGACNEFDLPGPEERPPTIVTFAEPACAARISADGEFVFVVDRRGVSLQVLGTQDMSPIERIRLDLAAGKHYAVLGVATAPDGEQIGVLIHDPVADMTGVRIIKLTYGEVQSESQVFWRSEGLDRYMPSLSFDLSGDFLAVHTGRIMRLLATNDREIVAAIAAAGPENKIPGRVSQLKDFQRLGVSAMQSRESRSVLLAMDASSIAFSDGDRIHLLRGLEGRSARAGRAASGVSSSDLYREIRDFSHEGSFAISNDAKQIVFFEPVGMRGWGNKLYLWDCMMQEATPVLEPSANYAHDPNTVLAISEDGAFLAAAMPRRGAVQIWHLPDCRSMGVLQGCPHRPIYDARFTASGSFMVFTSAGELCTWEADGNGNAWPWSRELVKITHQPIDESSVVGLQQAHEMRRRGWLTIQETNLLDLALAVMENKLSLDVELDWGETCLPGDNMNIQLEQDHLEPEH